MQPLFCGNPSSAEIESQVLGTIDSTNLRPLQKNSESVSLGINRKNGNAQRIERQADAGATQWQTTDFTYDILNHVLTVKDPLERVTNYTYDESENLSTVIDANTRIMSYFFDERNLLLATQDDNLPRAGIIDYSYDSNGNLSKIINRNNSQLTTYTYDSFDRMATMTYADGSLSQYDYDKDSNLIRHTTPSTKKIEYDYDALNRLTAKRFPLNAVLNSTYGYDVGSRMTSANNAAANNGFTYDGLNRLKTTTQTLSATAYTLTYNYDKAGNRSQLIYPGGKTVDYVYDAGDRLATVKANGVALSNYLYDPLDRRTQKDLIGTATQRATYQYDIANQVKQVMNQVPGGAGISQFDYTYDNVGNRQTMTTTAGLTTYNYNRIYELTGTTGLQSHTYDYDTVANRKTADGTTYLTNNLNQYTKVGPTNFSSDSNGNLTNDGINTYTYDEENRLATVQNAAHTSSYAYDALNRRVSKTVDGVKTCFIYDDDETIQERSSAGALAAEYVFGDDLDEVLTMERGGSKYFYHYDALGSVTEITNSAGTVVESYTYDVYGKPNAASTIGNPYQFTGARFDSESGLYYLRARIYDPQTGRFVQRDPIGYKDSMNLYQYV